VTRIVVVEPDGAGGMIHYAYQMCSALSAAGAEVTLITRTDYELAALPHTFQVGDERTSSISSSVSPATPRR